VGSALRAEYTVYGNAINLSARLMRAACSGLGAVLCDAATRQLGAGAAAFLRLQPLQVPRSCSAASHSLISSAGVSWGLPAAEATCLM
jgi:hypothetical protein